MMPATETVNGPNTCKGILTLETKGYCTGKGNSVSSSGQTASTW